VDIYAVLEREQRSIGEVVGELARARPRDSEKRRSLMARLREALFQYGRATNPMHAALLRRGARPAPILAAIETHDASWQYLTEVERHRMASPGFRDAVALLGRLLDEHFATQAEVCALARELLPAPQARRLGRWHEAKCAAEDVPASLPLAAVR
jgi:hypothetical protein